MSAIENDPHSGSGRIRMKLCMCRGPAIDVLGVELVLKDSEIVRLGGPQLDPGGLDLFG